MWSQHEIGPRLAGIRGKEGHTAVAERDKKGIKWGSLMVSTRKVSFQWLSWSAKGFLSIAIRDMQLR